MRLSSACLLLVVTFFPVLAGAQSPPAESSSVENYLAAWTYRAEQVGRLLERLEPRDQRIQARAYNHSVCSDVAILNLSFAVEKLLSEILGQRIGAQLGHVREDSEANLRRAQARLSEFCQNNNTPPANAELIPALRAVGLAYFALLAEHRPQDLARLEGRNPVFAAAVGAIGTAYAARPYLPLDNSNEASQRQAQARPGQ